MPSSSLSMENSFFLVKKRVIWCNIYVTIFLFFFTEISSSLTGMTNQLSQIAAEKLTATDQLMKDNIGKLIKQRVRNLTKTK